MLNAEELITKLGWREECGGWVHRRGGGWYIANYFKTSPLSQIKGGADVAWHYPHYWHLKLTFLGIKQKPKRAQLPFPFIPRVWLHCCPMPAGWGPLRLRPRIKSFGPFHLSFMTKTSQPFAKPLKIGQFTYNTATSRGKEGTQKWWWSNTKTWNINRWHYLY